MTALLVTLMSVLAACGEDGSNNNDTVLTGFSGILIFGIVVWLVYRYFSKKG